MLVVPPSDLPLSVELIERPDNQFGTGFGFRLGFVDVELRKSIFENSKKQIVKQGNRANLISQRYDMLGLGVEVDCSIETENEVQAPENQFITTNVFRINGEPGINVFNPDMQTEVLRIPEMALPPGVTPT